MNATPPAKKPTHEEPEVTQEESVPTDGRDTEGEEMMKKVSNPKLQEKGSAEEKTPQKSGEAGKTGKDAARRP